MIAQISKALARRKTRKEYAKAKGEFAKAPQKSTISHKPKVQKGAKKLRGMRAVGAVPKSLEDVPKRKKLRKLAKAGETVRHHGEKAKLYLHQRPGLKTAGKVGLGLAGAAAVGVAAKKLMKKRRERKARKSAR